MNYSNYQIKPTVTYNQNMPNPHYLIINITSSLPIDKDIIKQQFQSYGIITQFNITTYGYAYQVSLQFKHFQNAIKARQELYGKYLIKNGCKINISIHSNNKNNDENNSINKLTNFKKKQIQFPPLYTSYNRNRSQPLTQLNIQNNSCFNSVLYLQFNNLQCLVQKQQQIQKYSSCYDNNEKCQTRNLLNNTNLQHKQIEVDHLIEKDINKLLQTNKTDNINTTSSSSLSLSQNSTSSSSSDLLDYYLCFNINFGMDNQFIYNLFSLYGNISYIKQTKYKIYIKFRKVQYVQRVKRQLEGRYFCDNQIKFINILQLKQTAYCQNQYAEIIYFDETYDRINGVEQEHGVTQNVEILFQREVNGCNKLFLRKIAQKYGKIYKIQLQNDLQLITKRAIIRFMTIQSSLNMVAQLHRKRLLNQSVNLRFIT